MRTGYAVIGANFGDEGKGIVTDFLCSRMPENCTVVRFNGGAQAGHTVVAPDGRRHVFSHFGAGSFSDCPTFLSQFFIVNPRIFKKEFADLKELGLNPKVTIDGRSLLTTPLDVLINQIVEMHRDENRHGSCGVGINETVTRCLRDKRFQTQVQEVFNTRMLRIKLFTILREWLPERLLEHGLTKDSVHTRNVLSQFENVVHAYIDECESLLEHAEVSLQTPRTTAIVFEGAQGLMLDEDRLDQFPHVTRSKTGVENVAFLCEKFGISNLHVIYTTRSYLTRHGAGPLHNECRFAFPDSTNVPNPFQGALRYAPLNVSDLAYSIDIDWRRARFLFPNVSASLAVTCLDQLPMPSLKDIGLPISATTFGPCRSDVKFSDTKTISSLGKIAC